MKKNIGVITIGQAPRTDLIPAVEGFFNEGTQFVQRGVLDHFGEKELEKVKPEPDDTVLVSRLRDGTRVTMAKEKILASIQDIIDDFNELKVDLIVLACTGEFKPFKSQVPVIYPDYLLNHVVQGVFRNKTRIGVITPLPEQAESIETKWKSAGFETLIKSCSPYDFNEKALLKVADEFKNSTIDTIVLDCIGYTEYMKQIVEEYSNKNVILSRNIVFRNIGEM